MLLTSLSFRQFRTYPSLTLKIPKGVSCFVGPNAVGKTNILEGVMSLSTGKSFRAESDREMIAWGSEVAHIHGETIEDSLELTLTAGVLGGQKAPVKRYMVNGVSRRLMDFVGKLPAVLFAPEHLLLISGSPSLRRRYLDEALSVTNREYRRALLSYEKGLRQRNKVLEQIQEGNAKRTHLFFWDQLLIREGGFITDCRRQFIDHVNSYQIAKVRHHIQYDHSVISESRLIQYADAEVASKTTLVGPHRDDFSVTIRPPESGISVKSYGSRGQQRLAVLWLKLAELTILEKSLKNRPILLLDDIFSELDREHDELVAQLVSDHQTLITSAEEETVAFLTKKAPNMTFFRLPSFATK